MLAHEIISLARARALPVLDFNLCWLRLKCDGTRAENRFRLSAKWTSPLKLVGKSVQSTIGRRAMHISLQALYCSSKPAFCSHVTRTVYPLRSLVSPSLLLPCVTVYHHISTGLHHLCKVLFYITYNTKMFSTTWALWPLINICATYRVQFVVETTGVAYWLSVVVTPP